MTQREHITTCLPRPESNHALACASELDLVTILAHDLRNYMTSIYGQLGKIRKQAEAEGRDRDTRLANNSIRVLDQMLALVTNVLDLARAERGIFDLVRTPVDLCGLTRHMADLLAREHYPISVSAPPTLPVHADGERLRQALHNLLANAVQYSPEGAPVEVSVGMRSSEQGSLAVITVRDYGPGIPAESILFQHFAPGPDSTGLGIGLFLAKQIAAAHGGNLATCAIEGPGACFELTIPVAFEVVS